ncbi:unnamed protein product [Toxocara canis]|uniref:t-SNARE coiled-coil homology domain-containing protein n=1 Tax=Toxocara canis TaxID=6265 RepID=A0A183TVF5_TOXCA|nr:unnamed protein product [Toxocara canis]
MRNVSAEAPRDAPKTIELLSQSNVTLMHERSVSQFNVASQHIAIAMITRRQGRMRDERKSAQEEGKGINDEMLSGVENVMNKIETEVDEAAEEVQRSLDIIIRHWNSVTIGIVMLPSS